MDWGGRTFDVVIGNPPFRNQLATATSRGGRSPFGGGPYADTAAEFLALAMRLARPDGGRVGLVLPQSILTTRDAAAIRDGRTRPRRRSSRMWSSPTLMFDAQRPDVRAGVRARRSTARGGAHGRPEFVPQSAPHAGSWGSLLLDDVRVPCRRATGRTLGDIATFAVDFRDQYYGLVGAVGDDADGPPLITSGLIDPGVCLWGERPARFAKQRYAAPRVDLVEADAEAAAVGARRASCPRSSSPTRRGASRRCIDRDGAWLPSVPVITCTSDAPRRRVRRAVLDSQRRSGCSRQAAGSGLGADTVRLSPRSSPRSRCRRSSRWPARDPTRTPAASRVQRRHDVVSVTQAGRSRSTPSVSRVHVLQGPSAATQTGSRPDPSLQSIRPSPDCGREFLRVGRRTHAPDAAGEVAGKSGCVTGPASPRRSERDAGGQISLEPRLCREFVSLRGRVRRHRPAVGPTHRSRASVRVRLADASSCASAAEPDAPDAAVKSPAVRLRHGSSVATTQRA